MRILVTGCAGFIGSHVCEKLLSEGFEVIGLDNFNNFYDPRIKTKNLETSKKYNNFELYKCDINDFEKVRKIFLKKAPKKIIHLAAGAGVRPSILDPYLYANVNVLGTVNLLKLASDYGVEQFILGSSSSVYGISKNLPFAEDDLCQNIISPYGASKRSSEIFAQTFAGLKMNITILRFFTVYGPRGRPDMAPAIFTRSISERREILQYGDGSSSRDYTYIDDIVDGIFKASSINFPFEIINLGNSKPVRLYDFIKTLEGIIGKKARIRKMPRQAGDVEKTWANIVKAKRLLKWVPKTKIEEGLKKYIEWLKEQKN